MSLQCGHALLEPTRSPSPLRCPPVGAAAEGVCPPCVCPGVLTAVLLRTAAVWHDVPLPFAGHSGEALPSVLRVTELGPCPALRQRAGTDGDTRCQTCPSAWPRCHMCRERHRMNHAEEGHVSPAREREKGRQDGSDTRNNVERQGGGEQRPQPSPRQHQWDARAAAGRHRGTRHSRSGTVRVWALCLALSPPLLQQPLGSISSTPAQPRSPPAAAPSPGGCSNAGSTSALLPGSSDCGCCSPHLAHSFSSFTDSISPLRSCTTALTRCPHTTSGGPMTATSGERAEGAG